MPVPFHEEEDSKKKMFEKEGSYIESGRRKKRREGVRQDGEESIREKFLERRII